MWVIFYFVAKFWDLSLRRWGLFGTHSKKYRYRVYKVRTFNLDYVKGSVWFFTRFRIVLRTLQICVLSSIVTKYNDNNYNFNHTVLFSFVIEFYLDRKNKVSVKRVLCPLFCRTVYVYFQFHHHTLSPTEDH